MFRINVDLTTREVKPPADRRCASGHIAPEQFRREGPQSEALPTRFFHVKGRDGIDGIYCEPCYTLASHVGRLKKEGKI